MKSPSSIDDAQPISANLTNIESARRKPGRPRVVRPAPQADERDYLEAIAIERDRVIEDDPLHRMLGEGRADSLDVLWKSVAGVAREAAALRWSREHAESTGADAQKIASRRVEALGRMAGLLLDAKKAGLLEPDHNSCAMQQVENLWVSIIANTAAETLPPETAAKLVAGVRRGMEGWRERVTVTGGDRCAARATA